MSENLKEVIPQPLKERVLGMSHYAKLSGHSGGRKLYKSPRRQFHWPTMALDCYSMARKSGCFAKERVKFRKDAKEMKLFTPTAPLDYIAIDILGELIATE